MRKIVAALVFAALLAPAAANAAGPDGEEGLLKRIATYLGLRGNGQSSPAAGPATTGGRSSLPRTLMGDPPPSCTCVDPSNLMTGPGYVGADGTCQPFPPPDIHQDYQMP